MDVVKSLSTRTDDRSWRFLFPFLCGVMMWFSIVLTLLVRAGSGRRRRMLARRALERYVLASPSTPVPTSSASSTRRQHTVIVPTSIRLATLCVVRRAVVVVGGDFARSPRIQYHATSLARCGRFDEIVLVGLDCGNQLSEALLKSGAPAAQTFYSDTNPNSGQAELDWEAVAEMESSRAPPRARGAVISTHYLTSPTAAPAWFEYVFPLKSLHWLASTAYRIMTLSFVFVWLLLRAMCIRVNAHGQMLLTDLIVIQSPPAVPFVGVVKYVARPLSWLYSTLFYYGGLVPGSWFHREALRDLREQCRIQRDGATGSGSPIGPTPRRTRFVFWPVMLVDWHNYGYTILKTARRPAVAVNLYKTMELLTCAGDVNLTVSQAMRRSLQRLPSLRGKPVVVLYDVAPSFFGPVSRERFVNEVVRRVPVIAESKRRAPQSGSTAPSSPSDAREGTTSTGAQGSSTSAASVSASTTTKATAITHDPWGIAPPPEWVYASSRSNRPPSGSRTTHGLVVVGSTSWTPDDDYTILIEALQRLDQRLQHLDKYRTSRPLSAATEAVTTTVGASSNVTSSSLANTSTVESALDGISDIWVLITGKGPARARFESAVEDALLSSHITVSTVYLQSYDQYSLTLGAADLGLCLHFSSSGEDLPMKGVDMVGSGLPVAALRYPAVGELMMTDSERVRYQEGSSDVEARHTHARPDLEECTRGWLFQTSSGLESLLSHLVGLDAQREGLRDLVLMPPAATTTASINSTRSHTSTSPHSSATLSSLAEMQARARQARATAQTWEENWNRVAYPVIESLI